MSCPSSHLFWPGFRSCHHLHLRISIEYVNIVCVVKLGFWGIWHYPKMWLSIQKWLSTPITERCNQPATAWNGQCAYDLTSSGSCNPPFSFHRKLKISQAEKYPDSRKNRLHEKTLRIQKFPDSKFPLKIPDSKSPEKRPNRVVFISDSSTCV